MNNCFVTFLIMVFILRKIQDATKSCTCQDLNKMYIDSYFTDKLAAVFTIYLYHNYLNHVIS